MGSLAPGLRFAFLLPLVLFDIVNMTWCGGLLGLDQRMQPPPGVLMNEC